MTSVSVRSCIRNCLGETKAKPLAAWLAAKRPFARRHASNARPQAAWKKESLATIQEPTPFHPGDAAVGPTGERSIFFPPAHALPAFLVNVQLGGHVVLFEGEIKKHAVFGADS